MHSLEWTLEEKSVIANQYQFQLFQLYYVLLEFIEFLSSISRNPAPGSRRRSRRSRSPGQKCVPTCELEPRSRTRMATAP